MGRKSGRRPLTPSRTLATVAIWLALAALSAWVAWQLHGSLIVWTTRWLQSDLPRPPGWNSTTLVGINRLSVLGVGSLWLGWIMYMESELHRSAGRQRLAVRALQFLLVEMILLAVIFLGLWAAS